ncbi:MAG: isochorismatase family protein [Acidobacteria bacterium]|nr:isochorismatase family protein [Acidobacteriota bacterium]
MKVEVPEYSLAESAPVDPSRTALIVVDMQNDFVRLDGALPIEDAAGTIGAIEQLRNFARRESIPVFYTQDSHYAGDPEFAIWGEHCCVGTDGWEIVQELAPDEALDDRVFRKDRYDGFFGTNLDTTLRQRGIDTLIICGTVANICVLYTAASAAIRWYHVILPVDAVSAITEFDLQLTIRQVGWLFQGTITRSSALCATESVG